MSLAAGTRLGPYEIQSALGAGGMGEVYRARDTRLDRTVAIKVLPETLAADAQFRERFDREARVIASLNHPSICTLHDVGRQDDTDYLVMEFLEGETLADRLANGLNQPSRSALRRSAVALAEAEGSPLRLEDALAIAIQIADALDKAHRAGIVHRDLKPGNIFLVRRGGPSGPPVAKLLDFGLAKATPAVTAGGLSMLPTTPPTLTAHGTILGTFQYMAPEQLEGKDADVRSDIFAFGAVLYEMLTQRKAFEGKSHASLIGAIMQTEPAPVSSVQPLVPRALDHIARKCLAKDPDDRWQSARDLLDELRWIAESREPGLAATASPTATTSSGGLPRRRMWRRAALLTAAVAGTAALAAGLTWLLVRGPSPRISRLTITPSRAAPLSIDGVLRDLAITPDGSRIIYVGANGTQLFVRPLDALEPVAIAKGAPRTPFVSPDGQWVGFVDGNTALKRVSITGGPAITVTALDTAPRGAAWLADDTIVFATVSAATGLYRVSAAGGTPSLVTKPDRAQGELDHVSPEALPGGRSMLFTILSRAGGLDSAQAAVLDLETSQYKVVVRGGSHAHYLRTGHLVYGAAGTLRAVAFDLTRMETRGTSVPVVEDVLTTSQGAVNAVIAADGTLAYVSGGLGSLQRVLAWVDRQSRETPIMVPPRPYLYPRITRDGRRIALFANDQENDIWLWDVDRATLTRVTFEPGLDIYPVWTPDGQRLIFGSERGGNRNLFWQAADGTGMAERLSESDNVQDPTATSPDGNRIIFSQTNTTTGLDIMQLHLDDTRTAVGSAPNQAVGVRRVTALVQTPFTERNGIIAPDGRWLAYEANDSGQFEIYVRPYPDVNRGHWQVSTGGGTRPLWTRAGQELFYVSLTGALMRVPVERGTAWAAGAPAKVVNEGYFTIPGGNPGRTYDISADGQRFLMMKAGGGSDQLAAPSQIVVVQNWTEELKRLVPAN